MSEINFDDVCGEYYEPENTCYICKEECSASSQTCGRCARNMTMRALGWNVYEKNSKEDVRNEDVKKDKEN